MISFSMAFLVAVNLDLILADNFADCNVDFARMLCGGFVEDAAERGLALIREIESDSTWGGDDNTKEIHTKTADISIQFSHV